MKKCLALLLITIHFSLLTIHLSAQAVVINVDSLKFGNVFTGEQKTITLKYLAEITAQNSFIQKIIIPDSAFSFEIFNGSLYCDSIRITFHPTQNISYNSALLYIYNCSFDNDINSEIFQGGLFSIPISAQGVLADSSY